MACRDCVSGGLHEGTPVGRVETVHGLPAYVTEPPEGQSPQGIIVIIPDVLGWDFNNSRILADTYARRTNSRVYLPEFFDGHSMSSSLFASMDIIMGTGSMIWKMFVFFYLLPFYLFFFFLRMKCRPSHTLTTCLIIRLPAVRVISAFIPFLYFNRLSVTKPRVFKWFHDLRTNEAASLPVAAAGFCKLKAFNIFNDFIIICLDSIAIYLMLKHCPFIQ